jgi:glutathione synthase/RimK-type ligase-like ATP-grasp enzyme
MRRVIKTLRHILYILFSVNILKCIKYNKKGSSIVIISNILTSGRFSVEGLCWEFGYIKYMISNELYFEYTSLRKPLYNKTVFWSPEITTTPLNLRNYPATLIHIAKQLESQGCKVFPNSHEISFFENKVLMHEQFKIKNIPHPKTEIVSIYNPNIDNTFNTIQKKDTKDFPLIWKGEHSCGSQDIKMIKNFKELNKLIVDDEFRTKNPKLILQQFFDIRKDLRVNVIGGEVVLCYWRKSNREEWTPTASKYGSYIDFGDLPEHYFRDFVKIFKTLNITTGGMDVIFKDDDPMKEFLILEISPRYSPNPKCDLTKKKYSYAEFKNKIFVINSWAKFQTREIFRHADKFVKYSLKNLE